MFEYDKTSQAESDRHTLLNNVIAQLGGEQWDAEALAQAYDKLDAGASIQDVLRDLIEDSGGKLLPKPDEPAGGTPPAGISGYEGNPGTESDNYAEPKALIGKAGGGESWYEASESEREAQYMDYASAAVEAGLAPLSEADWNTWQALAYQDWEEKEWYKNEHGQ
jgi:hypothetical protein